MLDEQDQGGLELIRQLCDRRAQPTELIHLLRLRVGGRTGIRDLARRLAFTDGLVEFGQDRSLESGVVRLVDALRSSRSEPNAAAVALRLRELLRPDEPGALAADDRTFLLARRVG